MSPGERVARANKAREVLNENMMGGVFNEVREALVSKLEQTPIGDTDTQHEIALTLQLLKQLRRHLENWIEDGALAEREIENENFMARMRRRIA